MWLLRKFRLHIWFTLVVCIIFLSEYHGLEYKILEEVRQAVGDESGESIHGSDYCRVVDLEFFFAIQKST